MVVPVHRVASVVLPELPCELAYERHAAWAEKPLAVVLEDDDAGASRDAASSPEALQGTSEVFAVNRLARARGVRPGMRVSSAMARSAELAFAPVSRRALGVALAVVADSLFEFGAIVEARAFDVVSVDVTGGAHLFGGEAKLVEEIASRIRTLGWRASVAISDGPDLATALARHAAEVDVACAKPRIAPRIAPAGEARATLAPLPIDVLPIDVDALAFFSRLGVRTLADLMRIDRAQLAARLDGFFGRASSSGSGESPSAKTVLGWLDGRDERPLVPYVPAAVLTDEIAFDDGVETAGQLVFALRGVVSRLSQRLVGRRQATGRIDLRLHYDRTIFRLSGRTDSRVGAPDPSTEVALVCAEPTLALAVDLPSPLSYTDDLFRALKAKLENLALAAPVVRLELALSRIDRAPQVQLDLSRDRSVHPDALPALLSELSAEIGAERVGVLAVHDDHRPELRTRLIGVTESEARERKREHAARREQKRAALRTTLDLLAPRSLEPSEPTRLLPEPLALGLSVGGDGRLPALRPGVTIFVGRDMFVVDAIRFDRRLDGVAWWSSVAASRDYLRVTLVGDEPSPRGGAASGHHGSASSSGGVVVRGPWENASNHSGASRREPARRGPSSEAWVYVDRRTGEVFLQGWWE